jgi:hypothetical protein
MDAGLAAVLGAALGVAGTLGASALAAWNARADRAERKVEREAQREEQKASRWLETRRVTYAAFATTLMRVIDVNYARIADLENGSSPQFPALLDKPGDLPSALTDLQDGLQMIELVAPPPIADLARNCFDWAYDVEFSVRRLSAGLGDLTGEDRGKTLRLLHEKCDGTLDLYHDVLSLMKKDLQQ